MTNRYFASVGSLTVVVVSLMQTYLTIFSIIRLFTLMCVLCIMFIVSGHQMLSSHIVNHVL